MKTTTNRLDKLTNINNAHEDALDLLVKLTLTAGPVSHLTDKYFSYAKQIIQIFADKEVVYAFFLRRRVIAALEPAIRLLRKIAPQVQITTFFNEGDIVPSEQKILEITGSYAQLSEIETLLLQKIGFPCVCANNAYELCKSMPDVAFIDMHARHATGPEMSLLAAYGASVGSTAAKKSSGKKIQGFIGSSQDLTAPFFNTTCGIGTISHALIGYAEGDVVTALKQLEIALPELLQLVALVDYRGMEITDAIHAANWFFNEARLDECGKMLSIRLDTHGGRFMEGLNYEKSIEIVGEWLNVKGEYNIVEYVMGNSAFQIDPGNVFTDQARRILFGNGVSVASLIHMRCMLDKAGFKQVNIIASSGFDVRKCLIAGAAKAPVNTVGTGSYLPDTLQETHATADIISYNGEKNVKLGREHLLS